MTITLDASDLNHVTPYRLQTTCSSRVYSLGYLMIVEGPRSRRIRNWKRRIKRHENRSALRRFNKKIREAKRLRRIMLLRTDGKGLCYSDPTP